MKKKIIFYILMLIILSLISPLSLYSATVADELLSKAQTTGAVRIIVMFKVGFTPEGELATVNDIQKQRGAIAQAQDALINRLKSYNVTNVKRFETIPGMAMEVDKAALLEILKSSDIASIEEDVAVPPTLYQSVPLINADDVWAQGYDGSGVSVAILDTGVRKTHEFLDAGKVVSEACYSTTSTTYSSTTVCPNGQSSMTGSGAGVNCSTTINGCTHGTHVAGIAAGTGGSSSSGLAPNGVAKGASVIAIQIFSRFDSASQCSPSPTPCALSYTSDQIKGLERVYALRGSYKIASANMSLGGGKSTTYCDSDSRKSIIDNLRSVGVATVIASGNESYTDGISYPACISSAVSVGATTKSDVVASYSNSGTILDLLAPGSSICSSTADSDTSYGCWNGTSMATPHVTGVFALLRQKNPTLSIDTLESTLKSTGVSITDSRNGLARSRINALAAANAIARGPQIGFNWEHCRATYRSIGSVYTWCYLDSFNIWILTNDDMSEKMLINAASSNHWFGFNVSSINPFTISDYRIYKY